MTSAPPPPPGWNPKDVVPASQQQAQDTLGELKSANGVDATNIVRTVGDVWRSWGWYVFERDGFTKPNEFGYGPDGYRLQIEAATQDDVPVPDIITAG